MQKPNSYQIIGLMSGTSGDGLDIAYCEFEFKDRWKYEIPHCETMVFPKTLGKKLMNSHQLNALELALLDVEFGEWMGVQVKGFCADRGLRPQAIASHGHTVYHQPKRKLSLQIGNGWALHQASGIPVINDFRMLDIQLGGQGAPLVPIGDRLLFSRYAYCLNLGGIANISMESEGERKAFDICPFNLLLNYFAQTSGQPYDRDGLLARSGSLLPAVNAALNKLPYYSARGAKSLGREDLQDYMDIIGTGHKAEDVLRTLVAHYVHQIKNVLQPQSGRAQKMLVTGGGAFNRYFMEELQKALGESLHLVADDPRLIGFKEALVFAFLGVLRLRGENNCLASVTGASGDSCGGTIYGNVRWET